MKFGGNYNAKRPEVKAKENERSPRLNFTGRTGVESQGKRAPENAHSHRINRVALFTGITPLQHEFITQTPAATV